MTAESRSRAMTNGDKHGASSVTLESRQKLALELERARRVAHKLYAALYARHHEIWSHDVESALEDYEHYWQRGGEDD